MKNFIFSCKLNDFTTVSMYIQKGFNINIQDSLGFTSLMWSYRLNYLEIFMLLLQHGADVNIKDKYGDSVITNVCRRGDVDTLKLLIEKGVDVNNISNHGYSPLLWGCHHGHLEIVRLLLQHGAYAKLNEALLLSSSIGYFEIVSELLKQPDIDINYQNEFKRSALMMVSGRNSYIVRLLVNHGADVNIRYFNNKSCLHFAYHNTKYSNNIDDILYFLCLEQLNETIRQEFLDSLPMNKKRILENYVQSINKLKRFRNRVRKYSGMCGLTPKKFYNLNKMIKKREFLEWWYAPEGYGGKRHLENMRRWFSVVHGV